MSIPRTGSQGLSRDLWALCHAACYEPDATAGHAVVPSEEVLARFAQIDVPFDPDNPAVPFSPKCVKCRQAGKRVMERRGLNREQVKRTFEALGAKWQWTSRETDEKRRTADTGEMVVTETGVLTIDRNVAAKARRKERQIQRRDARPVKQPMAPSGDAMRESARINSMWD
jgi:hypothetical protein